MSQNDKPYIRSSKKCFSSNWSYGQVECSFDNIAENIPLKSRNYLAQCAIMNRKYTFFRKYSFPQTVPLDTLNAVFSTPAKFCRKKAKKSLLSVPKWKKLHTFFKKLFFLKLFRWTRRMQFWQPLRENFEKRPKRFCSRSDKVRKT